MLSVNVNRSDSMLLHDQVVAEIRRSIAEGEIGRGERLPPTVYLASVLGVNKNTVIRALHILRDEGLLELTRGRGIRVVGTIDKAVILTQLREFLNVARANGYERSDVIEMIQTLPTGC
jgi:GntR family transcriptional regulator